MRFPKMCFAFAGWWGVISLTPLFFFYKAIGKLNPPQLNHPEFYFGFLTVALAWQIGFLVISRDPVRFRTMMLPAMIEKFGYAACCFVLLAEHQVTSSTAMFGAVDFVLGLGFLLSYLRAGCDQPPACMRVFHLPATHVLRRWLISVLLGERNALIVQDDVHPI